MKIFQFLKQREDNPQCIPRVSGIEMMIPFPVPTHNLLHASSNDVTRHKFCLSSPETRINKLEHRL